ncbi:serotriflin-like [Hyperolius riggenbachi]|uniref:serotriflin-like n=1 Tax=Hyperolius riggenbachi TaxID=752182 RepID=UPI0035A2FD6C
MNWLAFFSLCCLCVTLYAQKEEAFSKYSCENEDIKKYIVDRHNELRGQVKPAPANMLLMEWNEEAAATALQWAKKCKHGHSKPNEREISNWGCGENLYMANRLQSWSKVLQSWWDEHADFEHGKGAIMTGKVIGHYTQFVWHKSYQLGCAVHYCPDQELCYFYVCHYCPAGNEKKTINTPYTPGHNCANCTNHCRNGLCTNYCPYLDEFDECEDLYEMCDSEEEGMSEEFKIKNLCKETCNCR